MDSKRDARSRIRADLERRGVAPELLDKLTGEIAAVAGDLDPESLDHILSGASIAYGACDAARDDFDTSLRQLQEIEGLMGAFADELSKLDEALEVLAAVLRRMRTPTPRRPAKASPKLLH
ncbi:MAG: hypothetical protein MJE66_16515 [Proteobacteria bacterium]|nr:hypothetical protein [Pseudomonadota bacterium]